jgi:hypothetical protein
VNPSSNFQIQSAATINDPKEKVSVSNLPLFMYVTHKALALCHLPVHVYLLVFVAFNVRKLGPPTTFGCCRHHYLDSHERRITRSPVQFAAMHSLYLTLCSDFFRTCRNWSCPTSSSGHRRGRKNEKKKEENRKAESGEKIRHELKRRASRLAAGIENRRRRGAEEKK